MHNKTDKSLIAYGVSYLEEKPDRMRLLRINSKSRLYPGTLGIKRNRKSMPDLDSGFDSLESSSSAEASSESSSVTMDTLDAADDEDAWMEYDGYQYENLAMSGGGAKGYAYIGALKALQDGGVLSGIKRIVGTSAGAVIGGMLVVGATPQEIADFFKCDVKRLFQDKNAAFCLFIPRLLTKFGMNTGQRFYELYGDFLAKKSGDPDITFDRVYRVYRKELCVTVTNLSRMCSEYCHYTTTPDLPIRVAIKISMAFPGVYESMKTDLFGTGPNIYVDGGTLENFPVQYFDGIEEGSGKPIFNDKTIGLYLMSEDQFSHKIWQETFQAHMDPFPSYLPDTKLARERLKDELRRRKKKDHSFEKSKYVAGLKKDPYVMETTGKHYMRHYEASNLDEIDIKGPKNYFKAMLSTLLISQKHVLVQPADLKRTIGINCGYIDTKDTGIEPGDREFMIRQGYEQTREFLRSTMRIAVKRERGKSFTKSSSTTNLRQAPNGVPLRTRHTNVPRRPVSVPSVPSDDVIDGSRPITKPDSLFLSQVDFEIGQDSSADTSPLDGDLGDDSCFDLDQLSRSLRQQQLQQQKQQLDQQNQQQRQQLQQLDQQHQQQRQKQQQPHEHSKKLHPPHSPNSQPLTTLHENPDPDPSKQNINHRKQEESETRSSSVSSNIDLSGTTFTRL